MKKTKTTGSNIATGPSSENHNLQSVVGAVQESCNPINEDPEVKEKVARLMITINFDLRGMHAKVNTLKATPLCTGWMVFLNTRGSLAHIMHKDDVDEETYIRMRVPAKFHGVHPDFIQRWFYNRMVHRYII